MATLRPAWTLNRLIVLLLALGCLGLAIDVRYEHVDMVRKHWTAWIPIIYGLVMAGAGLLTVVRWGVVARRALFWAFALGLVVGATGLWLHNQDDFLGSVRQVLMAWVQRSHHEDEPPPLAPLAFCGIGLLGMAACARRFEPPV